jgi:hypothetical protein
MPSLFLFADYIGEASKTYYYRMRAEEGEWSNIATATTQRYDRDGFLTEVQEAGFRYLYNFAHPKNHLPREGIKAKDSWTMDTISGVSTGMYFFNMAVGIERGFITRKKAVQHTSIAIKFLAEEADRFQGAFPHWINGTISPTTAWHRCPTNQSLS